MTGEVSALQDGHLVINGATTIIQIVATPINGLING